jgi:hypothetical protein
MTDVLIQEENLEKDTHIRRRPSKEAGRDPGDASTNQEMPKIARKPPEVIAKA